MKTATTLASVFDLVYKESISLDGCKLSTTSTKDSENDSRKHLSLWRLEGIDFWVTHKTIKLLMSSYPEEVSKHIMLEIAKALGSVNLTEKFTSYKAFPDVGVIVAVEMTMEKVMLSHTRLIDVELMVGGLLQRNYVENKLVNPKIVLPQSLINNGVLA